MLWKMQTNLLFGEFPRILRFSVSHSQIPQIGSCREFGNTLQTPGWRPGFTHSGALAPAPETSTAAHQHLLLLQWPHAQHPAPSPNLKQSEPCVCLPSLGSQEKSNIYLPPNSVLSKCHQGREGLRSSLSSTPASPAGSLTPQLTASSCGMPGWGRGGGRGDTPWKSGRLPCCWGSPGHLSSGLPGAWSCVREEKPHKEETVAGTWGRLALCLRTDSSFISHTAWSPQSSVV